MSDKEKSRMPFQVTVNFDVEPIVSNEGAGRRLAISLKMFKDIVMKLSAKKVLILGDWRGLVGNVFAE